MSRLIVSFPKSGRTWLRVMLDDLAVPATYSHAGASHREARLPSELGTELADRGDDILFMLRDPRDTAVSGYYQATRRLKHHYQGTMSEFIRDPRHGIEKIVTFNRLWLMLAASRGNIHVLTYESMQEDTASALRKVLMFFGQERSDQEIGGVVERNHFVEMQRREVAGDFANTYGRILGARGQSPANYDPKSLKCRNGQVGNHRVELSDDDIAYSDALMVRLDYSPIDPVRQFLLLP
jgi:hypothetical protein